MEDHAIFKVSSLNPAGKCKRVSDYPEPNMREKTIRQVFDPTADCSQMGTVSWYITNTTEKPPGLCENSSSSGLRALCSFLSHISEWKTNTETKQLQSSHKHYSFIVFSFGFDFYTKEQHEITCLRQCTDRFQQYVQSSWAGTDRNFTYSPPQMETHFSLFFPQFLLVPENKLFFTERLISRNLHQNRTKATFSHQNESTYQAFL